MKRLFSRTGFLAAAAVLLTAPLKLPARSGMANTFRGEVTDTFCAKNGSHTEMMTKMTSMGRDRETCAKECAKIGAKYVLYDEAQKRAYKLDDQAKAQAFAGKKVRVSGTLDGDEIRVASFQALG
jgi:hypothetical protein